MRFYDRENEMRMLESHYVLSAKGSIMNTITGRRRIGKTRLIKEVLLRISVNSSTVLAYTCLVKT